MNNLERRKERFLKDSLPVRMGGIAANLARVGSFTRHDAAKSAVIGLLAESKYFIEWTAAEFEPHTAEELVEIQRKVVKWNHEIESVWNDPVRRDSIGAAAKDVSDLLIAKSGLAG